LNLQPVVYKRGKAESAINAYVMQQGL
jgi:hypothetical protein